MSRVGHLLWFIVALAGVWSGFIVGAAKNAPVPTLINVNDRIVVDRDDDGKTKREGFHDPSFLVRVLSNQNVTKEECRKSLDSLRSLHEQGKLISAPAGEIKVALNRARAITIQRSSVIFEIAVDDSKLGNYSFVKVSLPDGVVSAVEFGTWD